MAMRRKIVPVTTKSLARSGLECVTCARWERSSDVNPADAQRIKEERLRRIIKVWGECGKIVFVDGVALAYAQYGPAKFLPGAQRFTAGPVSDDAIFLACLNVVPEARGKGLGRVLLQSIEANLVKRRVKALETYAARGHAYPPGPIEFYLQNGFHIVRDDPYFPLMRLELKALVGWQINVQFALDGLKIPAARQAPAPSTV